MRHPLASSTSVISGWERCFPPKSGCAHRHGDRVSRCETRATEFRSLHARRGRQMPDQSGSGKVTLRWIGHAAFEIQSSSGTKILIDPYIKENPVAPEPLKRLDRYRNADRPAVICVSHSHGDHSA